MTQEVLNKNLIEALKKSDIKTVEKLIETGADVNAKDKDGGTALMYAARNGHTKTVEKLIELGADVNSKDKFGGTALIWVARNGRTENVEKLVELGADVNARDNGGWTALHWAAGHTETVEKLVELGADVNARDKSGWTALMHAASNGRTKTVEKLVELGADVNAKDKDGNTALIWAARNGCTETMKKLIELGADVNARDKSGWTALSSSVFENNIQIVERFIAMDKCSLEDIKAAEQLGKESKAFNQLRKAVGKREEKIKKVSLTAGVLKSDLEQLKEFEKYVDPDTRRIIVDALKENEQIKAIKSDVNAIKEIDCKYFDDENIRTALKETLKERAYCLIEKGKSREKIRSELELSDMFVKGKLAENKERNKIMEERKEEDRKYANDFIERIFEQNISGGKNGREAK